MIGLAESLGSENKVNNANPWNMTASHSDRVAISLADDAFVVFVPAEPIAEYLRKATDGSVVASFDDWLFAPPEGDPIHLDAFDRIHHCARLAETTESGQGSICEGLNKVRTEQPKRRTERMVATRSA